MCASFIISFVTSSESKSIIRGLTMHNNSALQKNCANFCEITISVWESHFSYILVNILYLNIYIFTIF